MDLPTALAERCWQEVRLIEEEKKMPYVTSTERMLMDKGRLEGLRDGIAALLEVRFGAEGLRLVPAIQAMNDPQRLQAILTATKTAAQLDDVRRLLS
jgi:hypothetical protein